MKLHGKVGISAAATWIPEGYEELPAECDGPVLAHATLPVMRVKSLPVSHDLAAPEMAVLAARDCLRQAGWEAARLDAVMHTHLYHQGHDVWNPAFYIADQLGTSPGAMPVVIQQACNGGLAAVEFASATLLADEDAEALLVTTADRFAPPAWRRWMPGRPWGYGDGATALLVQRERTVDQTGLKLLSVAHVSVPANERVFRGEPDFTPAPMWNKTAVDCNEDVERCNRTADAEQVLAIRQATRMCLARALADAGLEPTDRRIRYVVLPRFDQQDMEVIYAGVFDRLVHADVVVFGEHTGHIGPGDFCADLVEMRDLGMLAPGDIAIHAAAGGGNAYSVAVVEAGLGWCR